jgi:YD repeat-containing protein
MLSTVSILLALLLAFNTASPINPGNPGKTTGNMSTPGKSRLDDFQKILPAEPEFSSRKLHLSFVLNFQFEKLCLECHYENKRHQLTKVDYSNVVDDKIIEFHVVPSYDKNGNMKCFVHQYKYNYKNQLVEVVTGTGLNVEYKYDALGRRTEKIVSAPGGNKVTRYVNAGWRVLEERDENNALLKRYTYGNGIDEQVAQEYMTSNGLVTVLPMYDSTGNMIGITDDTGKLLEKYSYSVFGMPEFDYDINPPVIKSIYIGDGMFITDFSEPVKLESVTTGMKIKHEGVEIQGTFETGAGSKEIKFIPATPLQPGQMSVEIAETVEDECGNQMGSSLPTILYTQRQPPSCMTIQPRR